jgi:Family of unknown function (DUF6492)
MSTEHGAQRRTYAIVTPSHGPDFERCRALSESVVRHAAEGVDHFVVVARRDEPLFAGLAGPRTHVVVSQDILPWWLHQVSFAPKWWLNLRGRPVRGWILQQIVKLSVDALTKADVCIFIDSDSLLVKPFDPRAAERDGEVPLFRETLPAEVGNNTRWHAAAAALLGLPRERSYRSNYVQAAVTWRRANVVELHRHIERTTGRGWVEGFCGFNTMSEYVLYGMFCERVLGERSGHYLESAVNTLNCWPDRPLDEGAARALRGRLRPEHFAVMINSKSNTDVAVIRRVFDRDDTPNEDHVGPAPRH